MKKYRWTSSNSGITLISLIITIVVALILVGVGINKIVESDLIGNTEEAVNLTNNRVQTQQGRVDELLGIYDGIVDDTQEGPGDTGGDGGGDTGGDSGGDTENNAPEFTELPYIVDNSYPSITIACVHTDADGDTVTPKLYVWKTAEDESTSVAYTAGWSGSGDGQTYSEFYLNGDLDVSTEYSYYVELSDGKTTTNSATQTFTTGGPCETCNGTGLCPGELTLRYSELTNCVNCGAMASSDEQYPVTAYYNYCPLCCADDGSEDLVTLISGPCGSCGFKNNRRSGSGHENRTCASCSGTGESSAGNSQEPEEDSIPSN